MAGQHCACAIADNYCSVLWEVSRLDIKLSRELHFCGPAIREHGSLHAGRTTDSTKSDDETSKRRFTAYPRAEVPISTPDILDMPRIPRHDPRRRLPIDPRCICRLKDAKRHVV